MKQGSGISTHSATKSHVRPMAINEKAVSQIGQSLGNHTTDHPGKTHDPTERLHKGRGFKSPPVGSTQHHAGSQGKR